MLVCYFLPFIVNNRYLLFQVSSGHNSVTVQNRTHVRMNFFCLESLILSFLKVVQIPPESPCMCISLNLKMLADVHIISCDVNRTSLLFFLFIYSVEYVFGEGGSANVIRFLIPTTRHASLNLC